tara:strand:- start:1123 stop:1752 length:630 start_codon:yes stop_codon:yes gene_type:complete
MESLSPSQIRDINSLYHQMYEPEDELVECYLDEDQIRTGIAYEIYRLTESHDHFSDDQLSAVIDILTEMNLNMQKAEQSISKIIGEDVSLTETVVVLEEIEDKNLNEIFKRLKPLVGAVDNIRKRKPLMKFASDQLAKIPFSKFIADPARKPGTFRKALSKVGTGFVGKMVDDATGSNVQRFVRNLPHAAAGAVAGAYRGLTNKRAGEN